MAHKATHPEFWETSDAKQDREIQDGTNIDDMPEEFGGLPQKSEHVITVGDETIFEITCALQSKCEGIQRSIKAIKDLQESVSTYAMGRCEELQNELLKIKGIQQIFIGATSVEVKHIVNPMEIYNAN